MRTHHANFRVWLLKPFIPDKLVDTILGVFKSPHAEFLSPDRHLEMIVRLYVRKRLTNCTIDDDAQLELWYASLVAIRAPMRALAYNPRPQERELS
jgi:hypothetical protein